MEGGRVENVSLSMIYEGNGAPQGGSLRMEADGKAERPSLDL
jgi:hypothetical protein